MPGSLVHIDSHLPDELPLDPAPLTALLRNLAALTAQTGGPAVLGLWRGTAPPGHPAPLVITFSAHLHDPSDPVAVPDFMHVPPGLIVSPPQISDQGTALRIRMELPGAVPADAAPTMRWGDSFRGRRALILGDPLLDSGSLAASLFRLGLSATVLPREPGSLAAIAAGRPFDLAFLSLASRDPERSGIPPEVDALRHEDGTAIIEADKRAGAGLPGPTEGAVELLTLFAVALAGRQEGGEPVEAHLSVPSLVGRHVLVVEDVAMNRTLLEAMLAPTGASIELASDGAEAIAALRERPADLVLMDIQMPKMDGLEATRRIRRFASEVPVIALTANARDEDRDTYLRSGMNGYLAKPIRVDDLYAILHRMLG